MVSHRCLSPSTREKYANHKSDALKGLSALQEIIATALWRHGCAVGKRLESFARDFDRLDVPTERERLYALAQAG